MELDRLRYEKTILVHSLYTAKFFPVLPALQNKGTALHPVRIPWKETTKSLFFVPKLAIRRTILIGQLHGYQP